jgi:hypothetical protein
MKSTTLAYYWVAPIPLKLRLEERDKKGGGSILMEEENFFLP